MGEIVVINVIGIERGDVLLSLRIREIAYTVRTTLFRKASGWMVQLEDFQVTTRLGTLQGIFPIRKIAEFGVKPAPTMLPFM